MSQQKLAEAAGLSLSSVRDYENERRGGELGGLQAIRQALENEGVEFLPGGPESGPGVRLNTRVPTLLRRPTRLINSSLLIPAEWQGKEVSILVPREVLEDLGRVRADRSLSDAEYVALFERYRGAILTAAVTAIDEGRITPDQRVYVTTEDLPALT